MKKVGKEGRVTVSISTLTISGDSEVVASTLRRLKRGKILYVAPNGTVHTKRGDGLAEVKECNQNTGRR